MKHRLTILALGENCSLKISPSKFDSVKSAKSALIHALLIEEKFHFVLENYREFVEGLLCSSLEDSIFSDYGWSKGIGHMHAASRRLLNLLSTARLYLDQAAQDLNRIDRSGAAKAAFVKATRQEYDAHLAYRVLEALRNYSQHCGLPIHGGGISRRTHESASSSHWVANLDLSLDAKELKADKKFKGSVLKELEKLTPPILLNPLIREYVASLGRIHQGVRQNLSGNLLTAATTYKEMRRHFSKAKRRKDLVGLFMVSTDNSGRNVEEIDMFDKFIDRREALEKRCQRPDLSASTIIAGDRVFRNKDA